MRTPDRERYAEHTDEALLQLVIEQDVDAFEVLYDRHAVSLYVLLQGIIHDKRVAEELLQETFWRVWQKAAQYTGAGSGRAWLHRIARNQALDQLRRQKLVTLRFVATLEPFAILPQLQQQSPEGEVEQVWQYQQVQQALAHIPAEQRSCLELAYFEGLSQREIAKQTNTPLGTIKTRARIGMEKLAYALRGAGYAHNTSL